MKMLNSDSSVFEAYAVDTKMQLTHESAGQHPKLYSQFPTSTLLTTPNSIGKMTAAPAYGASINPGIGSLYVVKQTEGLCITALTCPLCFAIARSIRFFTNT